jgi:hypothetical protein
MCLIYPSYFPNIASYIIITQHKNLCFEVNDNYQKQTYRNRCYLYGANGKMGLHIPVNYTQNKRQKTQDILIDNATPWKNVQWKSIESAYKTAPFFEFYEDELRPLFQKEDDLLLPFVLECIEAINLCLELDFNPATSKVFKKESTENDFRFLVNARKTVTIQTKPYIQVFQAKHGYISNLSILDLLFNMGPETLNYLKTHSPIQINTEKHQGLLNF